MRLKHDESTVARFIQAKQEIARRLIRAYFDERGVDLNELQAVREDQMDALRASLAEPAAAARSSA